LEIDLKAAGIVAAAVTVALAATGCGSAESTERHAAAAPVRITPPPTATSNTCKTGGHRALRVHGVGCATAERVVRGFAAEGGSPGIVLTVGDFVCEERGRSLSCARGDAGMVYTSRP
jgi:hypothetical protein